MHVLYEEGGDIKFATLAGEGNTDPLYAQTPGGKKIKLKTKDIWLRFDGEAQSIFHQSQQRIADIDLNFLWECAGDVEFNFQDLARDYFGNTIDVSQTIALAMAIQDAPIYFRRKGRGQFLRAPQEQLQAALLAVERKQAELLKQKVWEEELASFRLPEELKATATSLLFSPDKNSTAYKAIVNASVGLKGGIPELLLRCGVIESAQQFHEGKFIKEHFPKGLSFSTSLQDSERQSWEKSLEKLPIAPVRAFSIDDATTTEIDDAFSVTPIPNHPNYWRVGVHIAAPGLTIVRGSALDELARNRLSTVYYPGGKITMLPDEVCDTFSLHAASNHGNQAVEDLPLRPAISLYVTVNETNTVVLEGDHAPVTRVERVPMAHNLRLDDWEDVITEASLLDASNPTKIVYQQELLILWQSARQLHAKRQAQREQNGLKPEIFGFQDAQALLKDFTFKVNEGRVEITPRARGSVLDSIVAEWMIFCNSTWGNQLAEKSVPGIYRTQKGWGPQRTRMQTQPGPHEGLGIDNYAWCTSPLRRYVDLVNQWQLIAMAEHGVTAKLVAPFKPKDADLMAIAADFDGTYAAYGEYQNQMERYWCLQYMAQTGLPSKWVVRHLKDGQCRVENIPLRLHVPELSESARGTQAEVEILAVDLLNLEASLRYLGTLTDTVQAVDEDAESA